MSIHGHTIPGKSKHKKPEVPVHKTIDDQTNKEKVYKTYSANFNSKRYRQKIEELENSSRQSPKRHHEVPESDKPEKISKKQLKRENSRIMKENQELLEKFNELEELSLKRIVKLKERIQLLQNINSEISNENAHLNEQYQAVLSSFEALKQEHELCKVCKSCQELRESLENCVQENNMLRSSNSELDDDVKMLKTVVYRLNVQLERYQEKLRNCNIQTTNTIKALRQTTEDISSEERHILGAVLSEQHVGHTHTPLAWGKVNAHTLGPLLDAYQDTIAEKEEIIQSYETELSNFTGKLKEVINENEALFKRLTEDDECSSKLKIEVEKLKKELKVVKEHNDVLIKKCSLKQDKMEEILKCYESKVEQLKRDYNVAYEHYYQSKNEITALKEKNKALINAQEEFKNERQNYIPVSVHKASVNECKKWYEELKLQYETEKRKLKENLDSQNKIIEELQAKIATLSNEKDELNNKIKQLKEQLKRFEVKHLELEHSLNEAQLAKTACKKQLNKAMSFARDLVTEQETLLKVLNERQKENKAVKRIGSEIATRMDSLKNQLKTVQKDAWQELTTVEQRIEEQNNIIESMKEEHQQELERLRSIIRQQEDTNLLLKGQNSIPLPHYLLFKDRNK